MPKVSTNINLDADLKKDAQELFHDLGLDLTTEIKNDKFNSETEHSINEFYEMRKHPENYKTYSNFSEIIEDMEKSDEI